MSGGGRSGSRKVRKVKPAKGAKEEGMFCDLHFFFAPFAAIAVRAADKRLE